MVCREERRVSLEIGKDKMESAEAHDEGLELVPGLRLSGIREKVHDDRSTVNGLLDGEESLSGDLHKREGRQNKWLALAPLRLERLPAP